MELILYSLNMLVWNKTPRNGDSLNTSQIKSAVCQQLTRQNLPFLDVCLKGDEAKMTELCKEPELLEAQ